MILVTVGTQYPFDRLVRAIDHAITSGHLNEDVYAQIGPGTYTPQNLRFSRTLDPQKFAALFAQSTAVIAHAGMGTISRAIRTGTPMLAMPRRRRYGEHVNDHQVGTARRFAELGHILVAYDESGLVNGIPLLSTFTPEPRAPDVERLASCIGYYVRRFA